MGHAGEGSRARGWLAPVLTFSSCVRADPTQSVAALGKPCGQAAGARAREGEPQPSNLARKPICEQQVEELTPCPSAFAGTGACQAIRATPILKRPPRAARCPARRHNGLWLCLCHACFSSLRGSRVGCWRVASSLALVCSISDAWGNI